MRAYERLLNYVKYMTPSDEDSATSPSSECQFTLGKALAEELQELGVADAFCDEFCYVYGHIPATPGYEDKTPIGFVAHMDTVADFCDHDVNPIIHENYDGGEVVLGESGRILSPAEFPHLKDLAGRTLLTTDGTTILGADDKAGVAEIMTLVERVMSENIPHGPLSIAFTPDEEVGRGCAHFDVERFAARYAYTVDGDTEGELNFETFNAASADVTFTGVNVHTGSAKDIMINAALVAMEFNAMLPPEARPELTEEYQPFYHLCKMKGTVATASSSYIIRAFDADEFAKMQELMRDITARLNEKYGRHVAEIEIKDQYKNMADVIDCNKVTIENASAAIRAAGVPPTVKPIRGGTDGSNLSYMGLPCPNLGTGGHAFHGPLEHITFEAMDTVVDILTALVSEYAAQ